MSFPFYAIFPTQVSKKYSIVLCYETTHTCAQGWETAALIRAQNMFCCQIVSSAKIAKITTQEMTAQSHPTAVDGNLLRGNLQIWNNEQRTSNERATTKSLLICGQVQQPRPCTWE